MLHTCEHLVERVSEEQLVPEVREVRFAAVGGGRVARDAIGRLVIIYIHSRVHSHDVLIMMSRCQARRCRALPLTAI